MDQFNKRELNNSLMAVNPEVEAKWHPTKNGYLTPEQMRPNSVWWSIFYGNLMADIKL